MRIEIFTIRPEILKSKIFKKVGDGDLRTWKLEENSEKERLITHTGQWKDDALLTFVSHLNQNKLVVNITWWSKNQEPDSYTKGIYLGRFSEALLNHFNEHYTSFEIFYK